MPVLCAGFALEVRLLQLRNLRRTKSREISRSRASGRSSGFGRFLSGRQPPFMEPIAFFVPGFELTRDHPPRGPARPLEQEEATTHQERTLDALQLAYTSARDHREASKRHNKKKGTHCTALRYGYAPGCWAVGLSASGLLPIPRRKTVALPPFPPLAFKHTTQLYAPAGVPALYAPLCPFRVAPQAGACECPELTPWLLPSGPLPRR